jgi:salicylate hydroxylase
VIGCDGIKSNVRREIVAADNPAAVPHFAHESAYRCLIDMDKASPAIGPFAKTLMIWVGPGAHLVTYPVLDKYLNVAACIRQSQWPHQDLQVVQGSRKDVAEAFSTWGPAVRALVDALPEQLSRWAMFDTLDHPLPSYVRGTVAVAGDAAHGSTPHFGFGAGMGVEDALVLVSVLERVQEALQENADLDKTQALEKAFRVYDSARRERSQFLVESSRRQGELYKREIEEVGLDWEKFVDDTRKRVHPLFDFDWQGTMTKAVDELNSSL